MRKSGRTGPWGNVMSSRRLVMQANTRRNTRPEIELRSMLHRIGLRYKIDARGDSVAYRADILFPRARVAVFVDGCFWHACPRHWTLSATRTAYWKEKAQSNRLRDRRATRAYVAAGWLVFRIWEHDRTLFPELALQLSLEVKSRNKTFNA
jgi:DNA mismatch endonuclease (patch repair protein)